METRSTLAPDTSLEILAATDLEAVHGGSASSNPTPTALSTGALVGIVVG